MTLLITSAFFWCWGEAIAQSERMDYLNSWEQRTNPLFVPCDYEYLNFKGAKLSKSRGAFVEVPYFLSRYDPIRCAST
jgi:hypothetical protein